MTHALRTIALLLLVGLLALSACNARQPGRNGQGIPEKGPELPPDSTLQHDTAQQQATERL